MNNPYALIFQGSDDGHVGLRFPSREKAFDFITSLEVFDDLFKLSDYTFNRTVLKLKKESPKTSLSNLFKMNLEYHN